MEQNDNQNSKFVTHMEFASRLMELSSSFNSVNPVNPDFYKMPSLEENQALASEIHKLISQLHPELQRYIIHNVACHVRMVCQDYWSKLIKSPVTNEDDEYKYLSLVAPVRKNKTDIKER